MRQKGFAILPLIIVIVVIIGVAGYFVYQKKSALAPVVEVSQTNQAVTSTTNQSVDKTAVWQTYTNKQYGFEFTYPKDVTVQIGKYVPVGGTNWQLGPNWPVLEGVITGGKIQTQEYFEISLRVYPAVSNLEGGIEIPSSYKKLTGSPDGSLVFSDGKNVRAYSQNSQYAFELSYSNLENEKSNQTLNQIISTFKFTK